MVEFDETVSSFVVVLDRSTAMAGERLEVVKFAVCRLLSQLGLGDSLGLVAFADEAVVAVPLRPMGEHHLDDVRRRLCEIEPDDGADLCAGYIMGLGEARTADLTSGVAVLLVSGAKPDRGETDPEVLAVVAKSQALEGIATSTLSVSERCGVALLAAIARGGAGEHRAVAQPDAVVVAFSALTARAMTKDDPFGAAE
ncbi:MAG: VWA domain-containing protein [Cryobacterium sp.]|nr:VWA domain-containing protein [Cryobacterium sp.]